MRRIEIDLLRTLAILCMVIYHLAYDLDVYYGFDINTLRGNWLLFAKITAILFLLISGISSALSLSHGVDWRKSFKRFAMVGGAALLVTAATYAAFPGMYVRFGILHLIAVAGLLLPFTARLKEWTIAIGIGVILLGLYARDLRVETSLLLPLGIRPEVFRSVDYFPLLPWFGVILIGYGIGRLAMRHGLWEKTAKAYSPKLIALSFPGRHSLLIYLIHQPIMLIILWLIFGWPRG